jgi:isoprenylcysteine carboxyl methyltransferase (ICMT) family protein YpbQ
MKAEQLNTTGAYSLMRHPLYVGNFLICLGWSLFFREWYIVIIAALLYWMYYERIIMAEEKHLAEQFGERFERWSTGTPAVFPRLKSWRKPSLPFSLRTVLRREHSTFFVIILVFTVLELIDHTIVERRFHFDVQWIVIFASGVLVYLVLRTLKNYTELLHVAGR